MYNDLKNNVFQMDPESDRQISDHVLRMHLFRGAGEQDGDGMPFKLASSCIILSLTNIWQIFIVLLS